MDNNPSSDGHFPDEVHLSEPLPAEPTPAEPAGNEGTLPTSAPLRTPGLLIRALAGLQASIVGIVWMFLCFFVSAFWGGSGIWSVPNLFATVFYGERAYQNEFFGTTWAGVSLIVVIYGVIGLAWGLLWKEHRKPFLAVYGALTGLSVCFVFLDLVWTYANPLIPLYAPLRQLQVAHILWGAALARSPRYSMRIAAALRPPEVSAGEGQPPGQEAAEIVSGEVIL